MSPIDPELQYALRMFSRFFDLIHQPMAIINRRGEYVYYNQESADLDGYTIHQALGRHMLDVYPKMKEEQSTMLQSLQHGVEYIGHYQVYYNAKGQAVDYQHTTAPLYGQDGSLVGVIEIGRNMSGMRRLQEQVVELNQLLYSHQAQDRYQIITDNPEMKGLIAKAKRLALNDVPVMLVGETGTGKELFARLIHRCSERADKPFIALNCGALPATLIESTLFGTVKGAFTGAENSKGYLELAHGGTLFLDELNAMPIEMQSKLLRFLQDKTFWKLGGHQQLASDVRIVAAMNESPAYLINTQRLRADLFYRLGVGILTLPSLSSRPDDIALLSRHFINKHQALVSHDIQGIDEQALRILQQQRWPGNVRMLENVIVRSMIMQEHDGPLADLAFDVELPDVGSGDVAVPQRSTENLAVELPNGELNQLVEDYERRLITNALNHSNGRVVGAANYLRISRTTLQYKIKKHGIKLGVVE